MGERKKSQSILAKRIDVSKEEDQKNSHEQLPLINEHKSQVKQIMISPKDISRQVD